MNRDDIIRMTQEAGPLIGTPFYVWCERFAELVAATVGGKCDECGKAQADGWALNCVKCHEDLMEKPAVAAERKKYEQIIEDLRLEIADLQARYDE